MTDEAMSGDEVGRTILLSPHLSEIAPALQEHGFSVVTWPELALQPAQNSAALDEAIENLFGYDWLVFANEDAVRFFLQRFATQEHDVSELDSLRVCAIGEKTVARLEHSRVHVDVIAPGAAGSSIVEHLATYLGGPASLQRLNFLIPQASIGREYLKREFEQADARADVVITYQTVAAKDVTRLSVLQSLLITASIDAVAFGDESDVIDVGRLFHTSDLSRLLVEARVFLFAQAARVAMQMGILASRISEVSSQDEMLAALIQRFST